MSLRTLLLLAAGVLANLGSAWAGTSPAPDPSGNPVSAESPAVEPRSPTRGDDGVLESLKPTAPPAESQRLSNRIRAGIASQGEYAPLALFSLGSLAVGGAFYAINLSSQKSNVTQTAGGRTSLSNAVGVAGLSALLAAGSYFYFSQRDRDADPEWDARVSGGVSPDGGVSAIVTFPLPFLSR